MTRYYRPDNVPKLDLNSLPEYISSSDEEGEDGEENQQPLAKYETIGPPSSGVGLDKNAAAADRVVQSLHDD